MKYLFCICLSCLLVSCSHPAGKPELQSAHVGQVTYMHYFDAIIGDSVKFNIGVGDDKKIVIKNMGEQEFSLITNQFFFEDSNQVLIGQLGESKPLYTWEMNTWIPRYAIHFPIRQIVICSMFYPDNTASILVKDGKNNLFRIYLK